MTLAARIIADDTTITAPTPQTCTSGRGADRSAAKVSRERPQSAPTEVVELEASDGLLAF